MSNKTFKLKATFAYMTSTGYAYTVSPASNDKKTAQADMDFFEENYTEQGNRAPGIFYSNMLLEDGEVQSYENQDGEIRFVLRPSMDFIREQAHRQFENRTSAGRRPAARTIVAETTDDDEADFDDAPAPKAPATKAAPKA